MSRLVRTRCKSHSTACGWSVCAQLTAKHQAFLIRSTSSKIWVFVGLSLSPVPCFRITCRTEAKSTPEQNPCSRPSHRGWLRATFSKPFRFARLQPRTSSSADARQRARSSCFHSSKRPQQGWRNAFSRFGDDVTNATRGTQSAEREYHVDHTPRN